MLGLTYETNQDGFLGGYEAAATSKTGTVATYGGEQFGSVTIYMDGYAQGIAYYNAHRKARREVVTCSDGTRRPRRAPSSAASPTRASPNRLTRSCTAARRPCSRSLVATDSERRPPSRRGTPRTRPQGQRRVG